ncbi:putative GTP-binding protein EngB [Sesamum angolense]|uniref:GTP-binding protein EngB n=1 Tax=Sesamum angolense TaxID=2727404 RepID=A0AAE1X9W3_9LAMI|nr:putative GTP-binding protein EngB [Sesamum angolense]
MPVERSAYNSDSSKGSRKVRVTFGKMKEAGIGVRIRGSKSSNVDKARGQVRVATGATSGLIDGVRNVEPKKKGNKKAQSGGNGNDAIPYILANEKSSKMRGRGKRDLKTKTGKEGLEEVIRGNSGLKRKRIYADREMVEDRKFDGNDKKSFSKLQKGTVRPYLVKGKKAERGKDHELKNSTRNTSLARGSKFKESGFHDKKIWRGNVKSADTLKHVQENGLQSGTKTSIKRRALLTAKTDLNQRKYAAGSEKLRKKKDQGKKSLNTDSDLTEAPPKKKKRVIRIDPHDISNKRLDDDINSDSWLFPTTTGTTSYLSWVLVNDSSRNLLVKDNSKLVLEDRGNTQAKMNMAENTGAEMSKNAQFRAIRPTSSILSFVEDNLLGRRRDIEFRRAGYNTELSAPLDNIPFSTGSERERIEVPVFRNKLEFFAAAKISSSFPSPDLPEIAFAGRSNVGKSSLLNALTRQWGVVRTSDKPGLTQTINFFKLGSKLSLVDLPGYGFAYAKEEVKEAWEELLMREPKNTSIEKNSSCTKPHDTGARVEWQS